MTNNAETAMQHNADMVTHAFITNYAVPCIVGIILIGLLAIAFEILKSTIRKQIKKHRAPTHRR